MATPMLSTFPAHRLWKAPQFSTARTQFSSGYQQRFHRSFVFLNHSFASMADCQAGIRQRRRWSLWGKKVLKTLPHAISTRWQVSFALNSSRLTALSTVVHKSYPH